MAANQIKFNNRPSVISNTSTTIHNLNQPVFQVSAKLLIPYCGIVIGPNEQVCGEKLTYNFPNKEMCVVHGVCTTHINWPYKTTCANCAKTVHTKKEIKEWFCSTECQERRIYKEEELLKILYSFVAELRSRNWIKCRLNIEESKKIKAVHENITQIINISDGYTCDQWLFYLSHGSPIKVRSFKCPIDNSCSLKECKKGCENTKHQPVTLQEVINKYMPRLV